MAQLNHTIIWSKDRDESAKFLAEVMGFDAATPFGHFAVIGTANGVSLDFATATEKITPQHYAFLVSEDEFDQIFGRIQAEELTYGSGPPNSTDDGSINRRRGGRGVYFLGGPDPHMREIMTRAETDS